jgi:hypothetical protein
MQHRNSVPLADICGTQDIPQLILLGKIQEFLIYGFHLTVVLCYTFHSMSLRFVWFYLVV